MTFTFLGFSSLSPESLVALGFFLALLTRKKVGFLPKFWPPHVRLRLLSSRVIINRKHFVWLLPLSFDFPLPSACFCSLSRSRRQLFFAYCPHRDVFHPVYLGRAGEPRSLLQTEGPVLSSQIAGCVLMPWNPHWEVQAEGWSPGPQEHQSYCSSQGHRHTLPREDHSQAPLQPTAHICVQVNGTDRDDGLSGRPCPWLSKVVEWTLSLLT